MSRAPRNHEKLQFRLGYRFADPDLLNRALTHSSAISPSKRIEHSYQRLEFLGDRVLGLVVADMLYRRYPKANEGELSRTLNTLVRKETCAIIARTLDLGKEMNLGESEARTGGSEKEAILGDVTEAVIGAIYCDGGLGKAYEFVERMFEEFLADGQANKADAKTTLQEWAQARGLEPPSYTLVERTGPDHAPEFTIAVALGNFEQLSATGPSKKIAEHKAAEMFLIKQQVWKETP
ncbi:ribonuclease III [Devosia naphthalenivorans]|jgi:ribonuclease-3|uniref:ribonuclease III n=1 Tax=Devosia naphthalenivorans TaxID=2082392 RepID=UPI000D39DE5C|nr:ribonuclease III [Devosia naphthalenivorans]